MTRWQRLAVVLGVLAAVTVAVAVFAGGVWWLAPMLVTALIVADVALDWITAGK